MAFVPIQLTPLAGPRQTRQVPISNCVVSTGSTMNGAGTPITPMSYPSPPTSASVTTGLAPNAAGVQSSESEHR